MPRSSLLLLALSAAGALLAVGACDAPATPVRSPRVPEPFRQPAVPPAAIGMPDPDAEERSPGPDDGSEPAAAAPGAPVSLDPRGELQEVVARLELELPAMDSFVLHACLPVPRGLDLPEPGSAFLAVRPREPGQPSVAAQWEVLVRDPWGRPEVLELLAPVARARRDRPGDRVRFDVVLAGEELAGSELPPGPSVPASARLLFGSEQSEEPPVLRARDVHGNVYELDIGGWPEVPGFGSARTLASGPAVRRRRVAGVMVPVHRSGRGEPLPHLLGVHAYWTQWSGDGRVSLDLRLHNGTTSGAREAGPLERTLGILYFDGVELVLPAGWDARPLVRDPFFGPARQEEDRTVVPIVRRFPAPPGGRQAPLHVIGPGGQFERRLTLGPAELLERQDGHAALEGLAFPAAAPGLWSWSNPETASYFPQRSLLGSFDGFARGSGGVRGLRADLERRRDGLRELLRTGDANGHDVVAEVMGWAHPWYVPAQGGTGGAGIQVYEGHEAVGAASVAGVELLMLLHRMNISRQPQAMFDLAGDPVGYFAWRGEDGVVPFDFRTNGGMVADGFRLPALGGPPCSEQVLAVHEQGRRPPYDRGTPHLRDGEIPHGEDNLWSFAPHDGQHMIRYTKNTKALVWVAADPMARDDLELSAELFRLQFHEGPHRVESWSPGVTLRVFEEQVRKRPGKGAHLGRDQAWGIDAVSAYYSVAPLDWRRRHVAWFARVARLLLNAAMPSGIVMRSPNPKVLYSDRYDAAQTYQSLFLIHAMRTINESALRASSEGLARQLDRLIVRGLDYLYFGPIWATVPARDGSTRSGPREAFAVALPGDFETPTFSDETAWGPDHVPEDGFAGGVEFFHCWWGLEYGYLAGDPEAGLGNRFLRRTLDCWTGARGYPDLLRELFAATSRVSSDNSGNWIGLVGRLEALGVRR